PIEADTHKRFAMPGEQGIPGYGEMALRIAVHGLFTVEGVLARQKDRVEKLGLLALQPTSDAAKKAQDMIAKTVDPESRINRFKLSKVEAARAAYIEQERAAGRIPVILG